MSNRNIVAGNGTYQEDRIPTSEVFGECLSAYTRKQAIADGWLIDVSSMAMEAGIKFPVVITATVFSRCVSWTGGGCQDESGRLWDVVWMLRCAIKGARPGQDRLTYRVSVVDQQTNKHRI